jgi:hypothetical protein
MFIVMMLLLIVSATATLAIHSTATELRASGYARQRMQTRYLAEAALSSVITMTEQQSPAVLHLAIERSMRSSPVRLLAPEEPPMAGDRGNYRIEMREFVGAPGVVSQPVETTAGSESLGIGMGYRPDFVVDMNDAYIVPFRLAGHRADGVGAAQSLHYLAVTYTARARTIPPVDGFSPITASAPPPMRRGYHEVVTTARAVGLCGPFGGAGAN